MKNERKDECIKVFNELYGEEKKRKMKICWWISRKSLQQIKEKLVESL